MARQEFRFVGFGGQGLLLVGIILGGTAAIYVGSMLLKPNLMVQKPG